jgi:hypothetical protein
VKKKFKLLLRTSNTIFLYFYILVYMLYLCYIILLLNQPLETSLLQLLFSTNSQLITLQITNARFPFFSPYPFILSFTNYLLSITLHVFTSAISFFFLRRRHTYLFSLWLLYHYYTVDTRLDVPN